MENFSKMKTSNRIIIIDTSTSEFKTIAIWNNIEDFSKFPIPNIGDSFQYCSDKLTILNYKVVNKYYSYVTVNGLLSDKILVEIRIYVTNI